VSLIYRFLGQKTYQLNFSRKVLTRQDYVYAVVTSDKKIHSCGPKGHSHAAFEMRQGFFQVSNSG